MDTPQSIFLAWLLKYSSQLLTFVAGILSAILIHRLTSREPSLFYYTSPPQMLLVSVPATAPHVAPSMVTFATFTLFLWNQGKAPAREVSVAHLISLPNHNVFPNLQRSTQNLPGGGQALVFPMIPQGMLVSIPYLLINPNLGSPIVGQVLSYVVSEAGPAKEIPVMLQRIFGPWVIRAVWVLMVLGLWVGLNLLISLIGLLAKLYYFN